MIVATPVQFQGLGASSAVAKIQQLLKMLPDPGGDRYNPHRTDGNLDARTVWALAWTVKNGIAKIPVLGEIMVPINWLINTMEGAAGKQATFYAWSELYNHGGARAAIGINAAGAVAAQVGAGFSAPSWLAGLGALKNKIDPAITSAAGAVESALNQALGISGGSGTTPRPVFQIQKIFYPPGTFAVRDPGQNQYRILRVIR